MQVKLISITQGEIFDPGGMRLTPEQLITYIARVSNPSNQLNNETADKLISYLIRNKHWSLFEMVDMTVSIVTSRAIAQQILRHRSFSFQEFSQRYAAVTEMEPIQLRLQAQTNRQSSTKPLDDQLEAEWQQALYDHTKEGQRLYQSMLLDGIAKECARMILPLTTQTTIYMKGSVRSWIHYLQIRTDEHTQLEHRQIGLEIQRLFCIEFPHIAKALGYQ